MFIEYMRGSRECSSGLAVCVGGGGEGGPSPTD